MVVFIPSDVRLAQCGVYISISVLETLYNQCYRWFVLFCFKNQTKQHKAYHPCKLIQTLVWGFCMNQQELQHYHLNSLTNCTFKLY